MTHRVDATEGPALLAELAPAGAAVAEYLSDIELAPLFPAERRTVERALARRRREFATARLCARRAMVALGHPPQAVATGECGAPVWPRGLVGSITHCAGYRGAVLARSDEYRSLGIDAEPLGPPLDPGVLELIATEDEREGLDVLAAVTRLTHWDRLLFSAKESVYKTWFPLTGRSLWFTDVSFHVRGWEFTYPGIRGSFTIDLKVQAPFWEGKSIGTLNGEWMVTHNLILTLVALESAARVRQ
jgi:4'-phosphopantetheinyl transferase EntD